MQQTQEFRAEARFQRVSPQKARLVLDLIKGRRVGEALQTVAFTKKGVAPLVEKVLRSAVQNANYLSQEQGLDVDVDNLYVKQALANDGPRMKRIRPAPQGRAFRYQRRMSHIVIAVAERKPQGLVTTAEPGVETTAKGKKSAKKSTRPAAKKAAAKESAGEEGRRQRNQVREGGQVKEAYGTESPSLWIPAGCEQAVAVAVVCGSRLRQAFGRRRSAEA